jgi:Ca2+-binding EF-hand superfamily protein
MTSTPSNTPNNGRSLDRQITTHDVDCLQEAFALFNIDRKEEITTMELGKVMSLSFFFLVPFNYHKNLSLTLMGLCLLGVEKAWISSF